MKKLLGIVVLGLLLSASCFADSKFDKDLTKFSKDNQNLKILGGLMGEEVLKLEDVLKIATLPTLNEARAKIASILKSPVQKLLSILLAPGSKIAILALEKSKQST